MRAAVIGLILAGAVAFVASGQDATPLAGIERPRFTFLRYQEDWSILRDADPASLTDLWDPIKYIPLNEDGSMWVSFGGSTRLRMESWVELQLRRHVGVGRRIRPVARFAARGLPRR